MGSVKDEEDFEVFSSLPSVITAYRGVTPYNAKYISGFSWTLDKKVADWFAHRFGEDGVVYQAEITKSGVFAYFSGRGERELVVDPKMLQNVCEAV